MIITREEAEGLTRALNKRLKEEFPQSGLRIVKINVRELTEEAPCKSKRRFEKWEGILHNVIRSLGSWRKS